MTHESDEGPELFNPESGPVLALEPPKILVLIAQASGKEASGNLPGQAI